jgi:hypothetical protein
MKIRTQLVIASLIAIIIAIVVAVPVFAQSADPVPSQENAVFADFISRFLSATLSVAASALVGLGIAFVRLQWKKFEAAQPDLADTLEWIARTAVAAAEQAGAAGLILDKKDYAVEVSEMWLRAKGMPIDLDMVDAAIEAAVYNEINRNKEERIEISKVVANLKPTEE